MEKNKISATFLAKGSTSTIASSKISPILATTGSFDSNLIRLLEDIRNEMKTKPNGWVAMALC